MLNNTHNSDWRGILNGGNRSSQYLYSQSINNNLRLTKYHIDFANKNLAQKSDSLFGGGVQQEVTQVKPKNLLSMFSNRGSNLLDRYKQIYEMKKSGSSYGKGANNMLDNNIMKYSTLIDKDIKKIQAGREKMASQPFFLIILIAMVGLFLFFSMRM
ncbi:MAG: hypothetical protein ACK5BE_04960 [Alphaproteobacteria bacterium]|jgi:hypothetical protein